MALFTATRIQVLTYLVGICPFSIAFLVFLNSSLSFVITDLIGQTDNVGDASGSLGFADELLAIVACPIWGLISDRFGIRMVCVSGNLIIGLALVLFVQAHNVYPQLLFGRLFFSLGGAAATTMVTAVLPAVAMNTSDSLSTAAPVMVPSAHRGNGHVPNPSVSSELTITPARYQSTSSQSPELAAVIPPEIDGYASASRVAGLAGMFTGCGALLALLLFLPLPARFQQIGYAAPDALKDSYYIVGSIAFVLAVLCFFGLRGLSPINSGESFISDPSSGFGTRMKTGITQIGHNFLTAVMVGFERADIALGYVGGFVARASSVAISLFIPLLVNAMFMSSGNCDLTANDNPAGLPDIKRKCPRAYVVAAELTGVSQMVALIAAPIFGYAASRTSRKGLPLVVASVAGVIGYPLFATQFTPDGNEKTRRALAFLAVCLIGISQIGAIVCSLGTLSGGVLTQTAKKSAPKPRDVEGTSQRDREDQPLLTSRTPKQGQRENLADLKGSVAGVYSFYGGVAILILTKLGGYLFDITSHGAPFYIMASFNGVLLVASLVLGFSKHQSGGGTG